MTFPGKNYPGQRGFPTPNSTPSLTRRRIFVVPSDAEWLGLLMGAVEVLREEWRWYEWGSLTPAEAADAFNTIIIDAFANVCPPVLPGGGRVIRLNPLTGVVEEGADDGTWQPPTGDYEFPPLPVRETDPICLAATNAANVLQLLYESITDSAGLGLTLTEAIEAFIVACLTLIGVAAAAVAGALIAIVGAIFAVVYFTASFLLSDLWDENFTKQLVCLLVACATNTDGVVTFGWDCFWQSLADQTNAFDLTSDQIRLYAQIMFILQVIGGADGLNAAGATTAITEADCSACDDTWCIHLDATDNDGGFDFVYAGTWVSGQGLQSVSAVIGGVLRQIIEGQFPLGGTFHVVKIQWAVDYVAGHQQAGVVSNGLWSDDFSNTLETGFMPSDTDPDWVNVWEGATDMFNIGFDVQAAHDADDGLGTIKWVEISGTGDKPDLDGWIDCI